MTTGRFAIGAFNATTLTNNGALVLNHTDALTINALISGSGTLVQATSGSLTLTAANTYGGDTILAAGSLTVGNPLALQNSTLAGGGLSFAVGNTAPVLGGLSGNGNFALASVRRLRRQAA